jgi:ribosome-associated translation inhibitor RaiA
MKVTIRTRSLEFAPHLYDHVRRRLAFALSRLGPLIRAVDVLVADTNGPRGGVDKLCRIRVRGDELPPIVVEAADADIVTAIDVASDRVGRAVVRTRDRRRGFRERLAYAR